ncbi:MAG: glycoside hydrolase family 3 N-terminal domain-containing protein [Ignavibacteriaceae bacterium]
MNNKFTFVTKIFLIKYFCVFFTICFVESSFAQTNQIESKIDSLLSRMTLEEKIGQLNQFAGTNKQREELVEEGKVGSFLGVKGAAEINRIQKIAIEKSRLKIPIIFGNDVIHGYKTTFPIPLAASCSWDTELVKSSAGIAAFEAASEGTNWTFAPMVDIARDPRWGRIAEGAGEDPYLGSVMAAALVEGFQGKNLSDKNTIAACAKHFVAYGAAEGGRDYNTVDISDRTLKEIYLPPFKAAVDAGVVTIMSAFNSLNGVPASANHYTITDILKNSWRFNGFVVSDYNSIGELINHGIAGNKMQAALKAITAGVDMDMVGDTIEGYVYEPNLSKLIDEKKLSIKVIDESVRRILRVKYRLGLFEHPYVDTSYFKNNSLASSYKDSVALRLAEESIVLLKNRKNILPLKKNIKNIAVIGPLADDHYDPLGPWAGTPVPGNVVTVLQGIKNLVPPSTKIKYIKGCEIIGGDKKEFDNAVKAAGESDIVILILGESAGMSGEAASRTNIDLPGFQEELAETIFKVGKPVVVVLMNGRPLTINWIAENIPSVLECWFLGDQTGNAIANVLFGNYNPSGKLSVSFPRSTGQIPVYYNHLNTGRPFQENNKYTSKYLDSPNTPLFPFGYGLSYTTFKYDSIKISENKIKIGDTTSVSVEVMNTGKAAGEEIVQLYLRDLVASVSRPVKELKGFKRIYLNPGEKQTVTFSITPAMLEFYNINMKKVIEPGKFQIMIGGNSNAALSDYFDVEE